MSKSAPSTPEKNPFSSSSNWGREKGRLTQEITQRTQENHNLGLQINKLKSQIQEQNAKILHLQSLYEKERDTRIKQESQIARLQKQLGDIAQLPSSLPNDKTITNPTLSLRLLNELRTLLTTDPKHRRPSQDLLDFSFLIKSLSGKAYRQLRSVFPLPCKETIRLHFYDRIRSHVTATLDTTKLPEKLAAYRAQIGTSAPFQATIGVDAAAIQIFHLMKVAGVQSLVSEERLKVERKFTKWFDDAMGVRSTQNEDGELVKHSNFFAYLLLPSQAKFPTLLLHVSPSPDGHFRNTEAAAMMRLQTLARQFSIDVRFAATDADTGTNTFHEKQEAFWAKRLDTTVEEVADSLNGYQGIWYVSDAFHLLKNARARLLNHPVAVNCHDANNLVTAADLETRLKLGKALTDSSPEGKMNDQYPLRLFRIENAMKEFDSGKYRSGFYIMCWALFLQVFCNGDISVDERLMLIDLTFWLFLYASRHVTESSGPKTQNKMAAGVSMNWKKGNTAVAFANQQTFRRVLNTLLALRHQLKYCGDGMSTKRLSSHDCENLFGLYRATNNYQSTWETVRHFIGHISLQAEIRDRLSLRFRPLGRHDYAGCVVESDRVGVGMRMLADVRRFAFAFTALCITTFWVPNDYRFHGYMDMIQWFRSNLSDKGVATAVDQCSPVKGCAISNRLSKFAK